MWPTGGPLAAGRTTHFVAGAGFVGPVKRAGPYNIHIYVRAGAGLGVRAGKPRRGVSRRAGWNPLYVHIYVRIGVLKKIRAGCIGRTGPLYVI